MARMTITASARTAGISGLRPSPSAQRSQKPPACSTWRPCRASLVRSPRRSTFGPRKPSIAGSRVSDATMVRPTTIVTDTATPYRELSLKREQPEHRDGYGQPGQQDRATGGVERGDGRVLGGLPGEQAVAVPADDEQRVVHAHAERHEDGDHRHPARDRDGVREDGDDRVAHPDRRQRRDERQERGIAPSAERDEQDDQRENDPQHHAGEISAGHGDILDRRTAQLDVQQRTSADWAVDISVWTAEFGTLCAWAVRFTVARPIVPSSLIWPPGLGRGHRAHVRKLCTRASMDVTAVWAAGERSVPCLACTTI